MKHTGQHFGKSAHGEWRAEDRYEIGNDRVLCVVTARNFLKDVVTRASVHRIEPNGMISHVLYQDFSKCLKTTRPARVSAKFVMEQHTAALLQVEGLNDAIVAHYAKEVSQN